MLSPQRECYEHTNMGDKRKKKRRILSSIATKPMSLHSTIKDSPITHGYLFVSRKAHMPYGAGARSQHNITINDWDLHWIWFMYVYNSHRALFTHKHISVGLLYYVVTCYNESVLALLCFFFSAAITRYDESHMCTWRWTNFVSFNTWKVTSVFFLRHKHWLR